MQDSVSEHCESDEHCGLVVSSCLHWTSASPIYPGKQWQDIVLRGRVSTTLHSALVPHGLVSVHGFLHSPLKQANLLAQSASIVHFVVSTIGAMVQDWCGFPEYPGGHLQVGWCPETVHIALGAQSHGSTHLRFLQASWDGQSTSCVHWGVSQLTNGLPSEPGGQRHLPFPPSGSQYAPIPHFVSRHGSIHCLLTHDSVIGHSESVRQPMS